MLTYMCHHGSQFIHQRNVPLSFMYVLMVMTLYCGRFGSRELIGGVAVQLEHADLFGLTVHSKIEPQSSGLEVKRNGIAVC